MPDTGGRILGDHQTLTRRFADVDEHRGAGAETLRRVCDPLGAPGVASALWGRQRPRDRECALRPPPALLDVHAAAEQDVFFPRLRVREDDVVEETTDAINDHDRIRDAEADAGRATVVSDAWRQAVARARKQSRDRMAQVERGRAGKQSRDRMAQVERGALAVFRANTSRSLRDELWSRLAAFERGRAGEGNSEVADRDPEAYVAAETS